MFYFRSNCTLLQLVGTDHCTFNSTQKGFGSDDFRKIRNGAMAGPLDLNDKVIVESVICTRDLETSLLNT
jgi:hypothetical protein